MLGSGGMGGSVSVRFGRNVKDSGDRGTLGAVAGIRSSESLIAE